MELQGKTALITGGNSGIGLATARLMLAQGARVAITGRDRAKLDEAAAELGPGVLAMQADVNAASGLAAGRARRRRGVRAPGHRLRQRRHLRPDAAGLDHLRGVPGHRRTPT